VNKAGLPDVAFVGAEKFSEIYIPLHLHELFGSAPDYSIDTVSELTRYSAAGNCE